MKKVTVKTKAMSSTNWQKKSVRFVFNFIMMSLVFLVPFSNINGAFAANCDQDVQPPAPQLEDGLAPGVSLFKSGGCFTDFGTTNVPRCVTLSPKGYQIHFWNFGKGDKPTDISTTPTSSAKYNLVARSDLNFFWEGGGNLIYRDADDSTTYYAIEKSSNTDVGQVDAINTTGIFHAGTTLVWDSFMNKNKTWDVFNMDNSCTRKLPYLESGVNADGSRFLWRLVITGKLSFDGTAISSRGNVSIRLGSKNGPTLDTVPTDNEGSFEFSKAYGAGEGVGNEEIWINQNIENKITLSFTFSDEAGNTYQDFKDIKFPDDFRDHKTQSDTKVTNEVIAFNLTKDKKVDHFDRDESATANSIIENLLGDSSCGTAGLLGGFSKLIAQSLCGLGVILNRTADKLLIYAKGWLAKVIGIDGRNY